jgi:hypothetical protein
MPTIVSQRWESLAETNPDLYEIFRDFQNQLNQVMPSILSGTDHPQIQSSTASPSTAGVRAAPGTLYIQRNAQSGALVLHVKDTGYSTSGWAELGAFGSIPPTAGAGFQAIATSNSITFYYDGTNGSSILTMYRANGEQSQVASGSTVITQLSPQTTYYFYPYFDERTQSLQWVAGTAGNPAIAFTVQSPAAAAQMRLAHRIPLAPGTNISVTTPASGTSPFAVGGGFGGFGRLA